MSDDEFEVLAHREIDENRFVELRRSESDYHERIVLEGIEMVSLIDGSHRKIPRQMEKIREDQVSNNAGGFVFQVSDLTRIRRFLILGSEKATYYQTATELTLDNAKAIINIIDKGDGLKIIQEIEAINRDNRNPKMPPLLFVLAICARYNICDSSAKNSDETLRSYSIYLNELHKAAFSLVKEVCRIPTHLFQFVDYCQLISSSTNLSGKTSTGWGRLMRKTICDWYFEKTPERLAMFLTKYPQREGWSHRDVFRLAHPKLSDVKNHNLSDNRLETEQLFRYAVKGDLLPRKRRAPEGKSDDSEKYSDTQLDVEEKSRALDLIEVFLKLKHEQNEEIIANMVKKYGLVREHLPTKSLNSKLVWESLFDGMPMTALIRNLPKMTLVECLDDARVNTICKRLTDQEELRKSRIHPLTLLTARATYKEGRGAKGHLQWNRNKMIVDALEAGFYKAFINAPPTGKRYLLALDISGSMRVPVSASPLSCRDAAAAMSLINLHNESCVKCVGFSHELIELPFTKKWTINKVNEYIQRLKFGRTDCAKPMLYAIEKDLKIDVFIIYTDNETYVGDIHPFEALKMYREKSGILDAKLIIMAMTSTKFSIADPTDPGMLDVVGFDSAVPRIIHEFVNGGI